MAPFPPAIDGHRRSQGWGGYQDVGGRTSEWSCSQGTCGSKFQGFQVVPVAKKRRNPDVEFLGEINVIPTLRTSWEDSQLGKIMEWIEKEDFP